MQKTLYELGSLWLLSIQSYVKPTTFSKYACILSNHLAPVFGNIEINRIQEQEIYAFTHQKLSNLSSKTVYDILSVFKMIVRFSEKRGVRSAIRLEDIVVRYSVPKIRILTKDEQRRLESYAFSHLDEKTIGILIGLYTGLRIGEICGLRWSNIKDGILKVRTSIQRTQCFNNHSPKTKLLLLPPKSACSVRDIPLPEFLIPVLEKQRIDNAYVLTGSISKYTEPRCYANVFKRHLCACGISQVSFHTLRHTFATRCIESGVDLKSLSEILGHASVNITLNRYVHTSIEFKRSQMQKLKRIL